MVVLPAAGLADEQHETVLVDCVDGSPVRVRDDDLGEVLVASIQG